VSVVADRGAAATTIPSPTATQWPTSASWPTAAPIKSARTRTWTASLPSPSATTALTVFNTNTTGDAKLHNQTQVHHDVATVGGAHDRLLVHQDHLAAPCEEQEHVQVRKQVEVGNDHLAAPADEDDRLQVPGYGRSSSSGFSVVVDAHYCDVMTGSRLP